MCEQVVRARIGLPELLAFRTAVLKKTEKDNLSRQAAAYRVMEDVKYYEKIRGLKNEISRMVVQQYAIGQITAPREKAIGTLMRPQALGVTDAEILNIYEWLKRMRENKNMMDYRK